VHDRLLGEFSEAREVEPLCGLVERAPDLAGGFLALDGRG
jgi:hypothetical protein